MSAVVIDGVAVREQILDEIRATIDAAGNPHVCLATVLVGDDKPSRSYINSKQKKAGQAGIVSRWACWRGARGLTARGWISYPQT